MNAWFYNYCRFKGFIPDNTPCEFVQYGLHPYLLTHIGLQETYLVKHYCQDLDLVPGDVNDYDYDTVLREQTHHTQLIYDQVEAFPIMQREGKLYIGLANPELKDVLLAHLTEQEIVFVGLRDSQCQEFYAKLRQKKTAFGPSIHDTDILMSVMEQACRSLASDVHFEPKAQWVQIRFRIDGLLQPIRRVIHEDYERVLNRCKILCNLDIAEKRLPQDGSFTFMHNTQAYACRINSCPTLYGEKLALRLPHLTTAIVPLHELGFEPCQLDAIIQSLTLQQGLMLVTGPTGSGKTLTLYSLLAALENAQKHLISIEDPIEIPVPYINQIALAPKIGLTFDKVLSFILRQDPDVIMVGEIRDKDSASLALNAAQTGHLVLSTVHAGDTVSVIFRLLDLGLTMPTVLQTVNIIIAQRLVRKRCLACYEPGRKPGCCLCCQGYKGRVGIFEVLVMTPGLRRILATLASRDVVYAQACEQGLLTLYQAGLDKVKRGLIDETALQGL